MNDDNRYVANVWQNDSQRILDNNWFDNRWNRRTRVLFVSKSLYVRATLILWMGAVSFAGIFASYQYPFRFRSEVQRVPRIFFDLNTSPPTRPA